MYDCPAFAHRHPTIPEANSILDGLGLPPIDSSDPVQQKFFTGGCFDNDDNPLDNPKRKKLPKPSKDKESQPYCAFAEEDGIHFKPCVDLPYEPDPTEVWL